VRQQAAARRALGCSLYFTGAFKEADPILEQGIALADTAADGDFLVFGENPQIVCRLYRGLVLGLDGLLGDSFASGGRGARVLACVTTRIRSPGRSYSLVRSLSTNETGLWPRAPRMKRQKYLGNTAFLSGSA
jgi:hypothetical protein